MKTDEASMNNIDRLITELKNKLAAANTDIDDLIDALGSRDVRRMRFPMLIPQLREFIEVLSVKENWKNTEVATLVEEVFSASHNVIVRMSKPNKS